jgi:hypothetical protein
MAYLYPILPGIYVLGEKQESSKPATTEKNGDQGVTSMFVGFALNHEGNCYRMWNPNTKKISETCNVVYFKRIIFGTPAKPVVTNKVLTMETLTVSSKTRGGLL